MTRPPVSHVTRRPHEEPPIRDDNDGRWLGVWLGIAALVALCVALRIAFAMEYL